MKRFLPLLILLGAIGSFGKLQAQTATCQDLIVNLSVGAYVIDNQTPVVLTSNLNQVGTFTGSSVWQAFEPATNGILHRVEVNFTAAYTPTTSFTLNVYQGEGTGGSLLATEVYSNITSFATGWNELNLTSRIDMTVGTKYTFQLIDDNGDAFQIQKDGSGLYADGLSSITSEDLVFRIANLKPPVIDNGSSAAGSGIASFTLDINTLTCANIGANTVTLTVTDNDANSSTCTSTVTIQDNENPSALCQNIDLYLDGTGNASIVPADIDAGSSDNCSLTYGISASTFTCTEVGANSVTLTVTDGSSNSDNCSASVTVRDTVSPVAVCQNHTLVLDGSGSATLNVSDVNNGSSDNCGIASSSLSKTSYTCGDLGTSSVTLTLNDVNGNSSSCTADITVEDNQAPTITCPPNDVVCATDASGAVYTYPAVVGNDNCTFNVDQTDASGLTSSDVFPVGVTTQEYTITETATGVTASCSFTVTVTPKPVSDFGFTPACEGEAVFFEDLSTIDGASSITSWSWDMGDGSGPITLVDPIFSYANTGTYTVELIVESAENCSDTSEQVIEVTPVPTAGFTVVNNCEGLATNFTNTSAISAGTLTYSWDFGDSNGSTDTDPSHTYAVDGTYTVTLTATSDNGCVDEITQSVEVYDSPNALFTASTDCEGAATTFTNLSSGNGTLTYAWNFGDGNSSSLENPVHTYALAGNYTATLTVTSPELCTSTNSVIVTVNALPTVDFSFSDVCEGVSADFVNLSTAGSTEWDFGDGSSSTLSDVSHVYSSFGTYDVTLTVTDANFCVNSATQSIEVFDLPDFSLTPTDVTCYNEATGSISTTPLGTPAFPWMVSLNGGTPQNNGTFLNLPADDYDVTIMDDNGCEFTVSTTVNQPSDTLGINLIAAVDVLCNGESSGEVNFTGTGGTNPYMYSVNGGASQSMGMFSGLPAGTHNLQIVDFNSCVFDTTITLTEPDTLVLVLDNASDLLCNGDASGEVTVSGTGGVGPYEYNLNGGVYGISNSFGGLAAGSYTVGVLDGNGCEDTVNVTLSEPGILMVSLLDSEDANCFGEASGLIEVAASSGTPGYQYSINGVTTQGSGLFEGLTAGTYTLTAIDANGCIDQLDETIAEPTLLTIETNSSPVACFGDATGEIEIIAGGGTVGYMYSIDEGATYLMNGGSFTNLASGEYITVVQDTNGCTASEGVILSQPNSAFDLIANASDALCLDSASGMAVLSGTGGTPTYTFSSDGLSYSPDNEFGGFLAGTYILYGQDLNGCTDSVEFLIGEPLSSVSINDILLNNPACPNEASGTALVQASGGTPAYTFSSDGGNTFQSNQILGELNGGNHIIVVQDANGCVDTDTISLTSPEILDLQLDTVINVNCEGDLNGELEVIAVGGTPSYNYMLDGGAVQSDGVFTNLTNGTYNITIMDVNGCSYTEPFEVAANQLLPIAGFSWVSSGQAVLFQNNSQFGDSYLWEFGDDSTSTEENPVHIYNLDGDYQVTLTVTNDCGENEITVLTSTISTGIADEKANLFKLYPNPTSGDLNLELLQAVQAKLQLEIFSLQGQLISSESISNGTSGEVIHVSTANLSQGVYYLRLSSDKDYSVLKFDIIK